MLNFYQKKFISFKERKNNFISNYNYGEGIVGFSEKIISHCQGCVAQCTYCYLGNYHKKQVIIFNNYDLLEKELSNFSAGSYYFNAGENADSLFLENYSQLAKFLIPYFSQTNNFLELRTKSNNVDSLLNLKHNKKTIISFSFSNLSLNKEIEKNTASLPARILAAKKCIAAGYLIGLRFEPLFLSRNYKKEIKDILDLIFTYLKAENIHSLSFSLFRFTEQMSALAEKLPFYKTIYGGEFFKGKDKKYRYLKPLRVQFYLWFLNYLKNKNIKLAVYLSSETKEVWELVFGKKIFNLSLITPQLNLPMT